MAFVSWRFAGATSIASGMPYFSTAIWILTPRTFLPPSTPRSKQLGAERQERLSITTVLGSAVSPHARRQERPRRPGRPRPRPEPGQGGEQREQRAERSAGELADGPPLHAAEAHAPDRHHR